MCNIIMFGLCILLFGAVLLALWKDSDLGDWELLLIVALLLFIFVIKCRFIIKGISNYNEHSGYVIVIISIFVLCNNFIKLIECYYDSRYEKITKWDATKNKMHDHLLLIANGAISFFDSVIIFNKIPKAKLSNDISISIFMTIVLLAISILIMSTTYVLSDLYVELSSNKTFNKLNIKSISRAKHHHNNSKDIIYTDNGSKSNPINNPKENSNKRVEDINNILSKISNILYKISHMLTYIFVVLFIIAISFFIFNF